jgi:hypothetical protein
MALADAANVVVNDRKPWELAKQEGKEAELHAACSEAIEAFRLLTLYLKPVLPKVAEAVEAFLGIAPLTWTDAATYAAGRPRDQRLQPPDDAHRSEADRRAGRGQQGITGPDRTCSRKSTPKNRRKPWPLQPPAKPQADARTSASTTS